MNGAIEAIVTAFLKVAAALFARSRTAVDGDGNVSALRNAGDRIRQWVQSRRAGGGVKPDQDRSSDSDTGVHTG